jgi:hypothetical protein
LPATQTTGEPEPLVRAFGQWEAAHSARPRTRTEIMPKLSDTQAVLLAAAAARGDLSVLPPPETIRLKGAAALSH